MLYSVVLWLQPAIYRTITWIYIHRTIQGWNRKYYRNIILE